MSGEQEASQGKENIAGEPDDSPGSGNFSGNAISSFVEFIHIRLALLGIEIKEAKKGLLLGVILLFSGAFFFLLSWAGIWVAVAAMISQHYEISWPKVVLGVALLHAFLGILLFLTGKICFSKANFRDSLNEIERDRQWLARYRKKK